MINEIFTGENNEDTLEVFKEKSDRKKQKTDEQPDTTHMPDLESEESTAQRRSQSGQGLNRLLDYQLLQLN